MYLRTDLLEMFYTNFMYYILMLYHNINIYLKFIAIHAKLKKV